MEQMKAQFKDSWQELKHLKTIVVTAMLIAIGVVLGFFFTIQVTDFLKIGFSFIANEMTALLFGPVVGGIMGGVTDIIKFVLKPTGAYFFGFTFNAILGAVIYGMILYHRPISLKRILIAKIIVAIIVNLLLGTYWLHIMYGKAFWALIPVRLWKQVMSVPIESFLFYIVAKALSKARIFELVKTKR